MKYRRRRVTTTKGQGIQKGKLSLRVKEYELVPYVSYSIHLLIHPLLFPHVILRNIFNLRSFLRVTGWSFSEYNYVPGTVFLTCKGNAIFLQKIK
jgi:hypothetical protein